MSYANILGIAFDDDREDIDYDDVPDVVDDIDPDEEEVDDLPLEDAEGEPLY